MARRIPLATYRVQLHRGFTFDDARRIVPYLSRLGISDLYCSPILRAREGSNHGYDVIDATTLNPELGGEESFARLQQALREHEIGVLLDIVPNHMAAVPENDWWMSVLENGPHSRYINYFDIEWKPVLMGSKQENKVLLPVLGKPYGATLESGELRLGYSENGFVITYYDKTFPVAPHTYATILEPIVKKVEGDEDLCAELEGLVSPPALSGFANASTNVNSRFLKQTIWRLFNEHDRFQRELASRVEAMNGNAADARSFDELDRLLASQWYRLSYWRAASEEINYRRFFDVSDLVGVRVESPEVFEARHRRLFELVENGDVHGLRIDHIDGLFDPLAHLRKLQSRIGRRGSRDGGKAIYVVVEKILGHGETLPEEMRCDGTTGYESLVHLNDLFIDPEAAGRFQEFWSEIAPDLRDYEAGVRQAKRQVIEELFSGEMRGLAMRLMELAAGDRSARDFSYSDLLEALTDVTIDLDVYRTYIRGDAASGRDRRRIEAALARAQEHSRLEPRVFEFLANVLLMQPPHSIAKPEEWLEFVMRWQQFTGRVMAKGVEDTAFYRYHRLIARNDVGGEPDAPLEESDRRFHDHCRNLAAKWPHSINTTSTHDTKRSEDVRARLAALPEFHDVYTSLFDELRTSQQIDVRDLHFVLQTVLGIWPIEGTPGEDVSQRLDAYFEKAAREGKVRSSWLAPDEDYERSLKTAARTLVESGNEALASLASKLARRGAMNSLAQLVLKVTMPGVPDFYQGTELWDLSLVDPDNRRPVDYELRRRMLDDESDFPALVEHWQDGRVKLVLTRKLLQIRRENREIFESGGYEPLEISGAGARHLFGFERRGESGTIAVVIARFTEAGAAALRETKVALDGEWSELLTRRRINALDGGELCEKMPFAVLKKA
jgi:(1->4)-alpha-D-glucan 1-alpha-D-glucosylmutase